MSFQDSCTVVDVAQFCDLTNIPFIGLFFQFSNLKKSMAFVLEKFLPNFVSVFVSEGDIN